MTSTTPVLLALSCSPFALSLRLRQGRPRRRPAGAGHRRRRRSGAPCRTSWLATGTVEPIQTVAVQAAGERADRADRLPRGAGREEGPGALRARPAAVPGRARAGPGAARARPRAGGRTRSRRPSATPALAEKEYVTAQQYDAARTTAAASPATLAAQPGRGGPGPAQPAVRHDPRADRRAAPGSLRVREGNLVRATDAQPLVTINQIRPILVRFAVPADQPRRRSSATAAQRIVVTAPSRSAGGAAERGHAGLRRQRRGHDHRHHPAQGHSFPTPTARCGRASSSTSGSGSTSTRTRWSCRPRRWCPGSRAAFVFVVQPGQLGGHDARSRSSRTAGDLAIVSGERPAGRPRGHRRPAPAARRASKVQIKAAGDSARARAS